MDCEDCGEHIYILPVEKSPTITIPVKVKQKIDCAQLIGTQDKINVDYEITTSTYRETGKETLKYKLKRLHTTQSTQYGGAIPDTTIIKQEQNTFGGSLTAFIGFFFDYQTSLTFTFTSSCSEEPCAYQIYEGFAEKAQASYTNRRRYDLDNIKTSPRPPDTLFEIFTNRNEQRCCTVFPIKPMPELDYDDTY